MVNMKGRWCLITGAARGIGYLTAKFMAEQGANLILHSRKLAHTEKVLAEVRALGVDFNPYYVPSDFLDKAGKYDYEGGLIGDKANTVVFDNSKVKRAVPDFVCTVRADQGLRKTLRLMRATPALQQEDPEFDAWCDKVIEVQEAAKKAF